MFRSKKKIATGKYRFCPYCAKEIREESIVCRYCGEYLSIMGKELKPEIVFDLQSEHDDAPSFTLRFFRAATVGMGLLAAGAAAACYFVWAGYL